MELIVIEGNHQLFDGGSMFGHAPRVLWQKWVDVEQDHRVKLCCRTLLIEDNDKLILFEAGIGAFFSPKMRERYGLVEDEHLLIEQLKKQGVTPSDIDHIILSHLHFDHAGGLLSIYEEGKVPELVFPNAEYWISKKAMERAKAPHARDKASFIPELAGLLEETGRVRLVEGRGVFPFNPAISYRESHGHTPGLLVVKVDTGEGVYYLPSDLIPGAAWVNLPITTSFDRYPELAIDEKKSLLDEVIANEGTLFLTHDPKYAFCKVGKEGDRYVTNRLRT